MISGRKDRESQLFSRFVPAPVRALNGCRKSEMTEKTRTPVGAGGCGYF